MAKILTAALLFLALTSPAPAQTISFATGYPKSDAKHRIVGEGSYDLNGFAFFQITFHGENVLDSHDFFEVDCARAGLTWQGMSPVLVVGKTYQCYAILWYEDDLGNIYPAYSFTVNVIVE